MSRFNGLYTLLTTVFLALVNCDGKIMITIKFRALKDDISNCNFVYGSFNPFVIYYGDDSVDYKQAESGENSKSNKLQ